MATAIPIDVFRSNLLFLLDETFASPARGGGNAYLDRQTGWFPTLERVDAELASRPVAPGATTVAGHVEHTRFYLEVALMYARGEAPRIDWKDSWTVTSVTPAEWDRLRGALADACRRLESHVRDARTFAPDDVGGALGALAHCAYHLGAVRQMLRVLA